MPARARNAAVMPFCAAQPEWRNLDCVPSAQALEHARREAAGDAGRTRHAVADRGRADPAGAVGDAEGRKQSRGMKPATVELARRDAADAAGNLVAHRNRQRWRRGPTGPRSRHSASAAATDGLLMCTIDSLCVSSYSSAWPNAALANAAAPTPTRSPVPSTRQGPEGDMATAAARVDRPNGVPSPARARPMTSRIRSFVVATTSAGRSSKVRPDTHAPSSEDTGTRTLISQRLLRRARPSACCAGRSCLRGTRTRTGRSLSSVCVRFIANVHGRVHVCRDRRTSRTTRRVSGATRREALDRCFSVRRSSRDRRSCRVKFVVSTTSVLPSQWPRASPM